MKKGDFMNICMAVVFALLMFSCSIPMAEDNSTSKGDPGDDGHNSLVIVSDEPVGKNCEFGGKKVESGIDIDNDGKLDANEVTSTEYVCNGVPGADGVDGQDGANGKNSLTITDSQVGTHCSAFGNNGGIRIRSGLDDNANGTLDVEEVDSTTYICNGANGANGRNTLMIVDNTVGTHCDAYGNGGTRIRTGLDDDGNNVLEASEVDSTTYICNGANGYNSLIVYDNVVGVNCDAYGNGGIRIRSGLDNGDGVGSIARNNVLETGEIDHTQFICNGANGADGIDGTDGANGTNGLTSLIVIDNAVGAACDAYGNGGQRIRSGLDLDFSGTLDTDEINSISFICNGADGVDGTDGANGTNGRDSLTVIDNAVGAACDAYGNGGQRIRSGLDLDYSGTLDAGEINSVVYICNGANGADGANGTNGTNGLNSLVVVDGAVGTACDAFGNGGQRIRSGMDTNNNNILDVAEVNSTAYICNGANGADGANGTNGTNGLNSLVNVTFEPSGLNCQYSGQKISTGLDLNGNGTLDPAEVSHTSYVCNGAPGVNGTDGTSTAIRIMDEPVGANCQHGGKKIESGPDANHDGIPDTVTSVVYSCNERVVYTPQGPSSSVCNSFTIKASATTDHCVFYDHFGNPQNFQGAASTYYISTGWCAAQCFDVANVQQTIPVCTGVGFYHPDVNTCTHNGL